MELISLASGSSGNCFYIESENSAILVDVGISTKQIIQKLLQKNKSPEKIKAILITHEHSDHRRGADVIARKLNIPIFATQKTLKSSFFCSNEKLLHAIKNNNSFILENFKIHTTPRSHSAADPVSFVIETHGKKISIITDLGYICKHTEKAIQQSNIICLESNYDNNMLENGPYLPHHKAWIKSDGGHLSNVQAAEGILSHASKNLQKVILSHLSAVNNTPQIAQKTFEKILSQRKDISPEILIAPRHAPTEIIGI